MAPSETPKQMRGAVVEEYGKPLVIKSDLAVPEPAPGQLLVKVTACSLCMSDVGGYLHHLGDIIPYVPGHEPVGFVVKVGPGVNGFKEGERVGWMPAANTCQNCDDCLSGAHRFCTSRINIGFGDLYGGFSEYCLTDPLSTVKIPDGLSDEEAAPLLCAGVTAYGALKKVSNVQTSGTLINVVGCGGVGHLVIKYAKVMGFRVHAFDVAEGKLQLARDCGADEVFDSRSLPEGDSAPPRAYSTIVVSGAGAAYQSGVKLTARRGQVVAVGAPHDPVSFNVLGMVMDNISLVTTNQGTKQELAESLDMAAKHGVKPIFDLAKLEDLTTGYNDLMAGKVPCRLVYRLS